jgi:DNA modification methylase
MPNEYVPPTRDKCAICEDLDDKEPIVSQKDGKASDADNFPIHNWYNFVLGYTPRFPQYILEREEIDSSDFVVDPFTGSGTTNVECKDKGIPSAGVEATDFFSMVAETKLTWGINLKLIKEAYSEIKHELRKEYSRYKWNNRSEESTLDDYTNDIERSKDPQEYEDKHRSDRVSDRYMKTESFVKLHTLKTKIEERKWESKRVERLFMTALGSIVVPCSHARYGPGFGISKKSGTTDVLREFTKKMDTIIEDLEEKQQSSEKVETEAEIYHGDSRKLSKYFEDESVDYLVTSPPYPGDHEYTKHSRLELMLLDKATTIEEFREIKKRMIRGSTTNIYVDDEERKNVEHNEHIQAVTEEIERRINEDNGTSGFEKKYTDVVWEYFGGMYNTFEQAYEVLDEGGKFVLLVADSHAFKMVHIRSSEILSEIAQEVGFEESSRELWQHKASTGHDYKYRENILTLKKPESEVEEL